MAHAGPEPKDRKLGRSTSADWTEVEDAPYSGPRLELPKKRGWKWPPEVESWWDVVSTMPHCRLWSSSDWVFALETAYMKADWWSEMFGGVVHANKSTEIRRREDQMGTTVEARRKLRIRYVDPKPEPASAGPAGDTAASVTNLSSRRSRLTS